MKENQVSLTAIMTAYMRARHAMCDTPKIFDDFLAYHLIPEERRTLIEQGFSSAPRLDGRERTASCSGQASAFAPLMQDMGLSNVLSRARYAEDNLDGAVKQGVRQYVILGAGMDTFAFRRPDLLGQLQVIEVDHPATQAFKISRIIELGWKQPDQLHFVPADFTRESLAVALRRSPYDPRELTFFSWLGVTMYLAREEVFSALRTISEVAPVGSTVVFDYFAPEKAATFIRKMQECLRQIGEPIKTCFDPSTLAVELASSGFGLRENLSPVDIQERYFQGRTDGYRACDHVHFAWAVVE